MPTTDTGPVTQPGTDVKPGPIAWFAGNPVAANLLMLFFIVGGIIAGSPVVNHQEWGDRSSTRLRLPRAPVRPAYRDMGHSGYPAVLCRVPAVLRPRGPYAEHGDDLRVLPDGRHRRGRRGGGRREHCGGTRTRHELAGCRDIRRKGGGRPNHDRRNHHDTGLSAVPVHHRRELPDRQRLPLRGVLRPPGVPDRSFLHSARPPVARETLEHLASA